MAVAALFLPRRSRARPCFGRARALKKDRTMPDRTEAAADKRGNAMRMVDFEQAPFLVIWETTQACGLACRHCRASARPWRDPRELSTEQGQKLIDEIADMGTPILVLSGGDPMSRPD